MVLQSLRRTLIISGLTAGTAAAVMMGLFGNVRPASAGEAGAAGSAAFTIDTNSKVTGAAVSAAVGKNGATAASYNSGSTNAAYSMGTGGILTVGMTNGLVSSIADGADAAPGTAQANKLSADAVQTNAPLGTVDIAGTP